MGELIRGTHNVGIEGEPRIQPRSRIFENRFGVAVAVHTIRNGRGVSTSGSSGRECLNFVVDPSDRKIQIFDRSPNIRGVFLPNPGFGALVRYPNGEFTIAQGSECTLRKPVLVRCLTELNGQPGFDLFPWITQEAKPSVQPKTAKNFHIFSTTVEKRALGLPGEPIAARSGSYGL